MSTLNIQLLCGRSIDFPELAIFGYRFSNTMINLHWLELPMAGTLFHGPRGVRAIEILQKVFSIHMRCFGTTHLHRYSERLPLQHFIKGHWIYINFDNFVLKWVNALVLLSTIYSIPGPA